MLELFSLGLGLRFEMELEMYRGRADAEGVVEEVEAAVVSPAEKEVL